MKKKILVILLALTFVVTLLPIAAFASYSDTGNHWARAAIEKWSDLGILQGHDGKFRPETPITRGEMAVIIDRLMDYQTAAPNSFKDLGQDFYTDAVLKANKAGIITDYAGMIRPTAEITREEAAVMLGRALGLAESTTGSGYTDSGSFSSWAVGYINAMTAKGFINGYNGKFDPKAPITRAETVTILDNAIKGLYSEAKEFTGTVTGTVIVNKSGVVLKNMTISGDLIIAPGVADGDVTLTNVVVMGNTIVRGGGANSIHINGTSQLGAIIIEKTDDGQIRIVTADGAVVDAVYVNDGNDDIILTGAFESVTIRAGVTVKAVGAQIDTVNITEEDATLGVDATSSVGTLIADAPGTVNNNGTITKAEINVNDVVLNGTKPLKVVYAEGVQGATDTGGGAYVPPTVAVSSVSVSVSAMTLLKGGATETITATVSPTNATDKTVTWTTSDPSIATVSNGIVTPLDGGIVTITATAGGKSATTIVTVGDNLVTSSTELEEAISSAKDGDIIFVNNMIGSMDTFTAYEITKPITIKGLSSDAKVYGSFIIKADGVTIDGLTMYTRGGGSGPLKTAIDVIAMQATITNNIFELPNPAALAANGGVGNGVTIWPVGTADASYMISGNHFIGYSADTENWSSSALQIAEGLKLSRFSMPGVTSHEVNLDGALEAALAAGNTYTDCTNNYVHSNWSSGVVYKFVYASNIDQFTGSMEYAGDNSTILLAAGTYELTSTVLLSDNKVNIIGAGKDSTIIQYKSTEVQNNGLFAVPVNTGLSGNISFSKIGFENISDSVDKGNYVFLSFPGTNENEAFFYDCSFDNFYTVAYFNNTHSDQDNNNKITITGCMINDTAWVYSQDDITIGSRPMQEGNITLSGNTGNSAGNGKEIFGVVTVRSTATMESKGTHATIQAAITAASDGDTITVDPGMYKEDVVISKPVTVIGAGASKTAIIATTGNATPLTFNSNDATVSGFTITHEYTDAELTSWDFNNNGVTFGQLKTGNTLKNCIVVLNRNGIYLNNCQNNIIDGNTITNNRTGINMTNTVNGTQIINNTISNNWTLGIVYYDQNPPANPPLPTNFNTVTIEGNKFFDNWYTEILIKDATISSGTLNVTDNTFSDTPVTYTTSADASLNEPGFAIQKPYTLGGSATKPTTNLPTLRVYNSTNVTLRYDGKTLKAGPDAEAFTTIQTAIDAAASGDTIKIAAGTFDEVVKVTNKSLTIIGSGRDVTLVKAISAYPGADNTLTIKDLAVYGNNASGQSYAGIFISNGTVTIENCNIAAGTGADTTKRGIETQYNNSANIIIRNCYFSGYEKSPYFNPSSGSLTLENNNINGTGLSVDPPYNSVTISGNTDLSIGLFIGYDKLDDSYEEVLASLSDEVKTLAISIHQNNPDATVKLSTNSGSTWGGFYTTIEDGELAITGHYPMG